MTTRGSRAAIAAAIVALAGLLLVATAEANHATVVTTANMQGWAFAEEGPTGSGSLVTGPGAPPLGAGSARLTVDGTGRELLGTAAHSGTALADITTLEYATYRASGAAPLAAALQLEVDYDATDANTAWQGRLVFEPYFTNAVSTGAWQTWDTLTASGSGNWWASGAPGNGVCPQSNPCTWSEVLAAFPNAALWSGDPRPGLLLFRAGGPWTGGFDGNVDALTVGVSGVDVTYDFEAAGCTFTVAGATMTLDADCTTDHTIVVPDGYTLDGNGHTITAVDPSGDHFRGAVVRNGGATAGVTNLTITTLDLANVCDAGDDRLRGILFEGASGAITNNVVKNVNQGASGCQEGNAIEVRNLGATPGTQFVVISGNHVRDYQKTGIVANGNVSAEITGNTVEGVGPVGYIAQNGIQVGFGATGSVKQNDVSGNWYTGADWTSAGILIFQADDVVVHRNEVAGSQLGVAIETWAWLPGTSASGNHVANNVISNAQVGVSIGAVDFGGLTAADPAADDNMVVNNTITSTDGDVGVRVWVDDPDGGFEASAEGNKVVRNAIGGFANEIDITSAGATKVHANVSEP